MFRDITCTQTHTPVPNASNVSGIELVQTIASDIANEIRQLEELLTVGLCLCMQLV